MPGSWPAMRRSQFQRVGRRANGPAPRVPPPDGGVASRILVARLIATVPLGVVLALGSIRLVFVTYRELTTPLDVATPIAIRVLRGSPEVVVAVIVAWMVAEILGAVAARRIALADVGVGAGLAHAFRVLSREPVASLARFWLPSLALVVVLVPSALAAASAWEAVGTVLNEGADPLRLIVTLVAFVGLWMVGLVLIGVVCAWRAAVWTVAEVVREGTFGGSTDRRPGHWRVPRSSATLWPGRPQGGPGGEVNDDDEDIRLRRMRCVGPVRTVVVPVVRCASGVRDGAQAGHPGRRGRIPA